MTMAGKGVERPPTFSRVPALVGLAFIFALLIGLGTSCSTGVSLKTADPDKTAVVFGRIKGWILGPDVLGVYARAGHESLRYDGFYLYDRRTKKEYRFSPAVSGFFEVMVPPEDYLLLRSSKDNMGRVDGAARFGRIVVKAGGLHNVGTIQISGKLAAEQPSMGRGSDMGLDYVYGTFGCRFSYPEEAAAWSEPLATFTAKRGKGEAGPISRRAATTSWTTRPTLSALPFTSFWSAQPGRTNPRSIAPLQPPGCFSRREPIRKMWSQTWPPITGGSPTSISSTWRGTSSPMNRPSALCSISTLNTHRTNRPRKRPPNERAD